MNNAPDATQENADKKKIKRDKVRSAWISFAGRIVAQVVGAIATVALGVMVLHRYTANDARPPAPDVRYDGYAQPHVIVITPAMLGLRDGGSRASSANQGCSSSGDLPATSTAHLNDSGAFVR